MFFTFYVHPNILVVVNLVLLILFRIKHIFHLSLALFLLLPSPPQVTPVNVKEGTDAAGWNRSSRLMHSTDANNHVSIIKDNRG